MMSAISLSLPCFPREEPPAAAPARRQVKPQTAMDVNDLDPVADFVTISAGQEDDHGIFAYVFAA
jgi:hypothetical protein